MTQTSPQPTIHSDYTFRRKHHVLAVSLFLGIWFLVCLKLYTASNDFPFFYHGDEAGKTAQVMDPAHSLNFNHPMLLLEGSILAVRALGTPMSTQSVVEAGRDVSALYTAIAVILLSLAGYALAGFTGLILTALIVGLCPPLVVYAHYMKEDAALVMGIAFTLVSALIASRPQTSGVRTLCWMALGAAGGVAASGKYVGIVGLIFACMVALLIPASKWAVKGRRIALILGVALAVMLLINHRAFTHWYSFRLSDTAAQSLKTAYQHGREGHSELTMGQPNTFVFSVLARETLLPVWIGIGLIAVTCFTRFRSLPPGLWLMLLSSTLWLILLSFNTIPFHRYILPITVQIYFLAAIGFSLFLKRLTPHRLIFSITLTVLIGLILAWQLPPCISFTQQFADDSRQRVRNWIFENIPAGSKLAAESYAGLEGPGDTNRFPFTRCPLIEQYQLKTDFFLGDMGSPKSLREQGFQYVVVCGLASDRFIYPQVKPIKNAEAVLWRRRELYRKLASDAFLIYRDVPKWPTYSFTNPDILIYQLNLTNEPTTHAPCVHSPGESNSGFNQYAN
jgi:hypothetical protein